MSHYHPFQKLCYSSQPGGIGFLLAATGPYILCVDLKNGGVLSKWPDDVSQPTDGQACERARNGDLAGGSMDSDPPAKRRKLSPSQGSMEEDSSGSSVSIELVSETARGQRRKQKKTAKSALPNVSHIVSTLNGRHVIAATAEDKCVRVFELDSLGRLKLLSERCMPKRLCAIAITRSQSTILAGDKFGDVYALPLHPLSNPSAASPPKPQLELPKPLKPSASELTVHTKGNREALRQQKLQKASAPKKQAPTFEHQLILGHVSLLTDLVVGADPSNVGREYILTADRDEHIRVSRGIPQAHVINNYCLGHNDFVSRLCNVPELPPYLISGGGEPSLRIYDWLLGKTVAEANLEENLKQVIKDVAFSRLPNNNHKRAVSCIRALYIGGSSHREEVIMIVVALEGTPIIFTYLFYPGLAVLKQDKQYMLNANVLDIVMITDTGTMLVSLDNVHLRLSTREAAFHQLRPLVHAFDLRFSQIDGLPQYDWIQYEPPVRGHETVECGSFEDIASRLEDTLQAEEICHEIEFEKNVQPNAFYSSLGEFLYGLENLRKKSQVDGGEQQAEDLTAPHPEEI